MVNDKPYDLEERTFKYAQEIMMFTNACSKTMANSEIIKQLIRSSGSVGANYIEAREALSKKDFIMRAKICRKEVKESLYWLRLLEVKNDNTDSKRLSLITEPTELLKIFASIVGKAETKNKGGGEA